MGGAECETEETCDPRFCPNLRIPGRHVAGKGGEPSTPSGDRPPPPPLPTQLLVSPPPNLEKSKRAGGLPPTPAPHLSLPRRPHRKRFQLPLRRRRREYLVCGPPVRPWS